MPCASTSDGARRGGGHPPGATHPTTSAQRGVLRQAHAPRRTDMSRRRKRFLAVSAVSVLLLGIAGIGGALSDPGRPARLDRQVEEHVERLLVEGQRIFRFDTFGNEAFWGDTLQLHQAIKGAGLGGVGPGVSPKTALDVGLKVDVEALPGNLVADLRHGRVNLDDPAVTVALLSLDAVVGVTGFFDEEGGLRSVGIQCALCHSTVDDSLAPGIGHRLDGWPNRDLNVGAIINLSPDLSVIAGLLQVDEPTVR